MSEEQLDLFSTPEAAPTDGNLTASAAELGARHEQTLAARGERKRSGAYYTPPDVVERLLDLALEPILAERQRRGIGAVRTIRVIDPACGSGNFLVAAAARIASCLQSLGLSRDEARSVAFRECVVGLDIDAEAVDACRLVVSREAGDTSTASWLERAFRVGDSLLIPLNAADQLPLIDSPGGNEYTWPELTAELECQEGFDLVIGNPPFLSQLGSDTARVESYSAALRHRFGDHVASYTDPAALFLLLGTEIARAGGATCLIQPLSTLTTRDAGPIRRAILDRATVEAMWIAEDRIFDAAVDVCAPLLRQSSEWSDRTQLLRGREVRTAGTARAPETDDMSWAGLLATAKGIPERDFSYSGVLDDFATATADFRDQYYGLAPHVVDSTEGADDLPPLVTAGLIDPARLLWGERSTKFNKITYHHPRVRVAELDDGLRTWAQKRLTPKVLLATQTRVLEAVTDPDGELLPSVPVITITASADDLWRIGAMLSSPPVTLIAARRHLGAALSADALKLSAREVLQLPTPAHREAWDRGAKAFEAASRAATQEQRSAHLADCAHAMCAAYGAPDDDRLVEWWRGRLPKERRGT